MPTADKFTENEKDFMETVGKELFIEMLLDLLKEWFISVDWTAEVFSLVDIATDGDVEIEMRLPLRLLTWLVRNV